MSETKADMIANGELQFKHPRGLKGWYVSSKTKENIYYDSFYELIRMKVLDSDLDVLYWTKKHGM